MLQKGRYARKQMKKTLWHGVSLECCPVVGRLLTQLLKRGLRTHSPGGTSCVLPRRSWFCWVPVWVQRRIEGAEMSRVLKSEGLVSDPFFWCFYGLSCLLCFAGISFLSYSSFIEELFGSPRQLLSLCPLRWFDGHLPLALSLDGGLFKTLVTPKLQKVSRRCLRGNGVIMRSYALKEFSKRLSK